MPGQPNAVDSFGEVPMELIRFEHVYKTYGQGEGQVHALAVCGDRERSDAAADSPYQYG